MAIVVTPSGKNKAVKNLGWLLRHARQVFKIFILSPEYDRETGRETEPTVIHVLLVDGTHYVTTFACLPIFEQLLKRSGLKRVPDSRIIYVAPRGPVRVDPEADPAYAAGESHDLFYRLTVLAQAESGWASQPGNCTRAAWMRGTTLYNSWVERFQYTDSGDLGKIVASVNRLEALAMITEDQAHMRMAAEDLIYKIAHRGY